MLRQTLAKAFGNADPRILQANVGLWLDKMLLAETPSSEVAGPCARSSARPYRRAASWRTARGGLGSTRCARARRRCVEAKTSSRSSASAWPKGVLESGIALDRTWGVPYLPGSALKGLCAAAANRLSRGPRVAAVAGLACRRAGPGRGAHGLPGAVRRRSERRRRALPRRVVDGIPGVATALPLAADVMTVHHPDYYQRTPETAIAPTDFDEPVPVPFLSVASASFLVAIEGPAVWCEAARALLSLALEDLGIGAKTSSGLGRLRCDALETEC